MLKKIAGILAFLAFLSLTSIISLLMAQDGLTFDGGLAQAAIVNLIALVVFSGLHLLETHCHNTTSKLTRTAIWLLGFILLVYGALTFSDTINVKDNWNFVVSLGILYITMVQLQLLDWEKRKGLLKLIGLLIVLANTFLVIFFFTKLSARYLSPVLDISVITSVFAFLIGLVLSRKKKVKAAAAES